MVGQHVQSVSVHHDGTLRTTYLTDQRDGGVLALPQSRADSKGIEVLTFHAVGEIGLLTVHLQYGFRHSHLHDAIVALRRVHRHLTGSRAQTGTCGEDGSTRHTVAAGDDQRMPHRTFMHKVTAMAHTRYQVGLFLNAAADLRVADIVGAQADVQHTQTAEILLAVGKHHTELFLLKGQRQISANDILSDIIGVVLAHQP